MSDPLSLEFLRKEAKTILKQCRAGDASALARMRAQLPRLNPDEIQLADIHQALARENGYENWSALKRHDAPLARFLAAVRSGGLAAARQESKHFPDLAGNSIHAACAIGDADAVRHHMDQEPDSVSNPVDGWSPLLYASASPLHRLSERYAAGIVECVTLLLDRGVDTATALYRASINGNRSLALLLYQRGALPSGMSGNHATRQAFWGIPKNSEGFDKALRDIFEDPAAVEEMQRRTSAGASRYRDRLLAPNTLPRDLYRPAYPPNQDYNVMIWEMLIRRGVQPDWSDTSHDSPLHHLAVWGSDTKPVEFFLTHGADPDVRRADGKTPYFLAVRAGNRPVANVLVAFGAHAKDVRPADRLIGACRSMDVEAAHEIIRTRPEVLKTLTGEDQELLITAAGKNEIEAVRFMARLGFDPGAFGESGATALHAAAWHGHVEMTQLLLSFHAPANARDRTFGTSPLGWAAHGSKHCRDADDDYCGVIDALLNAGADHASSVNRFGIGPEAVGSQRVAARLKSNFS